MLPSLLPLRQTPAKLGSPQFSTLFLPFGSYITWKNTNIWLNLRFLALNGKTERSWNTEKSVQYNNYTDQQQELVTPLGVIVCAPCVFAVFMCPMCLCVIFMCPMCLCVIFMCPMCFAWFYVPSVDCSSTTLMLWFFQCCTRGCCSFIRVAC